MIRARELEAEKRSKKRLKVHISRIKNAPKVLKRALHCLHAVHVYVTYTSCCMDVHNTVNDCKRTKADCGDLQNKVRTALL